MPATPAWPPRSLPRLYVHEPIAEEAPGDSDVHAPMPEGPVQQLPVADRHHLALARHAVNLEIHAAHLVARSD